MVKVRVRVRIEEMLGRVPKSKNRVLVLYEGQTLKAMCKIEKPDMAYDCLGCPSKILHTAIP